MSRELGQAAGETGDWAGTQAPCLPEVDALLCILLDELAFGITVVDARRRVLLANRIAERQIVAERCLMLSHGLLEGGGVRETEALQEAIDTACQGRPGYLTLGRSHPGLEAVVLPLRDAGEAGIDKVVIVTGKCVEAGGLGLYNYARACGLTQAEERLLGFLGSGISVAEAAVLADCATNTARAHVRSILIKTRQPTLRALVGLVGRLPPVATRAGTTADPAQADAAFA